MPRIGPIRCSTGRAARRARWREAASVPAIGELCCAAGRNDLANAWRAAMLGGVIFCQRSGPGLLRGQQGAGLRAVP